jgi:N-acetyl-gamma-glutamyl-phosphate reductase
MIAAVLGVTGYTGQLLARLLIAHPEVSRLLPCSSSRAGDSLATVDAGLGGAAAKAGDRLLSLEQAVAGKPDVVFSALPHLESARLCAPFFGRAVVIDLSADFRLRDAESFRRAYGEPPARPDLLPGAVYGLAEWHTEAIRGSDLIANPGCYPTATLLPLLPLLREGIVQGEFHVAAFSGISGAGRKVKAEYLYCERAENAGAYNPGKSHRHVCEIDEQLRQVSASCSVLFIPHLAPMRKGMCVSTVASLSPQARALAASDPQALAARVDEAYRRAYGGRPFIGLRRGELPATAEVRGSNRCDIGWRREGDSLLLFSAIDNLLKGASGQAVQDMNLRFGLEETAGLPLASEV